MTFDEFFVELAIFKPGNALAISHAEKFITANDIDLELFAEYILNHHKNQYFPTQAHLFEYWQKCKSGKGKGYQQRESKSLNVASILREKREIWKAFPINKILNLVFEIYQLKKQNVVLALLELEFLSIYSQLYFEAITAKELELDVEQKKNHLIMVKVCLENDENFTPLTCRPDNKFVESNDLRFEKTKKFKDMF